MALSEKRKKSQKNYLQKTFESVAIRFYPQGAYEQVKTKATQMGYTSMNQFVVDAIEEKIERGVQDAK